MSNYSLFLVVNLQRVCTAFVAHLSDFYMESSIKRLQNSIRLCSINKSESPGDPNRCSKRKKGNNITSKVTN